MARGDFPFNQLEINLQPIVARPRVRAEIGVPLNDRRPGGPTCRSERQSTTPPQPRPTAPTQSPPEDVIVLVDSAGVALGMQRAFSARVRAVHPGGASIASRCVEIPLV